MTRKPVYGERWWESSLERAGRLGEQVYQRTLARRVIWSPVKEHFCPQETECEHVSVNQAFASVMAHLCEASKECKKYHSTHQHENTAKDSTGHCRRFHSCQPVRKKLPLGNPFQQEGTLQMSLPKGWYSVTAHNQGINTKRTKVVGEASNLESMSLDFRL